MSERRDPFDSATRAGRKAYHQGLLPSDCPYEDRRKNDGRLTWSTAWRKAWLTGWREEYRKQLPRRDPDGTNKAIRRLAVDG